jgi:hypothetical protein
LAALSGEKKHNWQQILGHVIPPEFAANYVFITESAANHVFPT